MVILIIIFAILISFALNYLFDKERRNDIKQCLKWTAIDSVLSIIVMLALYYGVIK